MVTEKNTYFARELLFLLLCLFSISVLSAERMIKVAVIDSGLDVRGTHAPICPGLSRDFTRTSIQDHHGHGTHISDLINQRAGGIVRARENLEPQFKTNVEGKYCQIILKYYEPDSSGDDNLARSIAAIKYAITVKADIINYSGGGAEFNQQEYTAIRYALGHKIIVVAAAGNERTNLAAKPFYPASYDKRIIVVGAVDHDFHRVPFSNWGYTIDYWDLGQSVLARLPNNGMGYMSGTSQATAIRTGKIINKLLSKGNENK